MTHETAQMPCFIVLGYNGNVREAEAVLLMSNSPRNKRTNGEAAGKQRTMAEL
jgi:hypothetical protein